MPRKLSNRSLLLGRSFHLDLFEIGDTPGFLFLLIGGSGISKAKYEARAKTVNRLLGPALDTLEGELSFAFAFIMAPFDLPFNRLHENPETRDLWNRHVEDELLVLLPHLPFYIAGYSGGCALALNGVHLLPRCFGAAGLGADAVPADLEENPDFEEPVVLVYGPSDRVFQANREVIEELVDEGLVVCLRARSGGHALADYIANLSLAGLIRRAARIC